MTRHVSGFPRKHFQTSLHLKGAPGLKKDENDCTAVIYIYIIHIHMVQACITMELSQQEQGYSEITGNGRVHTMTISDYIRLALVIIHKYMYTDNFKERPVPRRRLG